MIRSMDDLMTASDSGAYRVLARKYRPTTFADLKGQEALVRTLSNAFAQGGWRMPLSSPGSAALARRPRGSSPRA